MSPEQKALFTEYEETQVAIKELEEKRDSLKPLLVDLIPRDAKIDTGNGTFTIASRKTWRYSEETVSMEQELKDRQKEEQQTGVAEAVDGEPYIVYKQKK